MSRQIIRDLLETRLETWAAAQNPPIPLAHENQDVLTTQTKPYFRIYLLPAQTQIIALEGAGREYNGVFQITTVFDMGIGTATIEAMEASLDALFPVNLRLTESGVTVQILSPMTGAPLIEEPDVVSCAVSCQYRAYVI